MKYGRVWGNLNDRLCHTHALVWYLTDDARLSSSARVAFTQADDGRGTIWIPGIVLVEIIYLIERARFPQVLVTRVLERVDPPRDNYALVPLDSGVIRTLQTIDRALVPEMPDRIVAASAKYLGLPLLSKDTVFSKAGLEVVW